MIYYDYIRGNDFFEIMQTNEVENSVAYRVPKDAEKALLLVDNDYSLITLTIKAADNVFGGKDLVWQIKGGYHGIILDVNTFIQRSGEYEGCILFESEGKEGSDFRSKLVVFEE